MEVVWSELALKSLEFILANIEMIWGEKVAQKVFKQIQQEIERLNVFPHLGYPYSDNLIAGETVRVLTVNTHNRFFYFITQNTIQIVVVWDNRQNPSMLYKILSSFH